MTVPALPTGATLTGVYIGNAAGNGTKQGTTNTTTFVQSKLLTAGAPAPLANTTNPIREKNIDKVHVGTAIYQSFLYEDMPPGRNSHMFSEATGTLTLTPAPLQNSPSLVRYYKTALQSYVSTNLNAVPEAPPEYHWIYILGLCERIAKAMGDVVRANNFGGDYRGNLQIAQQNFRKGA
jgi:hypothetical protein